MIEIVKDAMDMSLVVSEVKSVVADAVNNADFANSLMSNRSDVDDRIQTYVQHRIENEIIDLDDVLQENIPSINIIDVLPAANFCLLIFLRMVCKASESSI